MGVQDLGQLTVVVLHPVAFIHDHILPADLAGDRKNLHNTGVTIVL